MGMFKMIIRTSKEITIPAHRITMDDLASICETLMSRFECNRQCRVTIMLVTAKKSIYAFESVDDMLSNKIKIKDDIRQYTFEIKGNSINDSSQRIEMIPPFSGDNRSGFASIVAFSKAEGWNADILATARSEFNRHKRSIGWIYSAIVRFFVLTILPLMSGISAGMLIGGDYQMKYKIATIAF